MVLFLFFIITLFFSVVLLHINNVTVMILFYSRMPSLQMLNSISLVLYSQLFYLLIDVFQCLYLSSFVHSFKGIHALHIVIYNYGTLNMFFVIYMFISTFICPFIWRHSCIHIIIYQLINVGAKLIYDLRVC